MGRALLDILRTIAEALLDGDAPHAAIHRIDNAVDPVAAPRRRHQAELAHAAPGHQLALQRIARQQAAGNPQRARIRRRDEARRAG